MTDAGAPPRALPAHPAWFRFRPGGAAAGVHLGVFLPRDAAGADRFVDLGPQDVQALLAQGALRTCQDLRDRAASGRAMAAPERLAVPVPQPSKILCVAKNYVAHAREFGAEPPPEPVFFAKLAETLVAHGEPVVLPRWLDTRVDHEAELGVILGFADPEARGRKHVAAADAMALVAGYTPCNDVTARTLQGSDRDRKWPWLRSKSLDTFCPVGPFVVPADAVDAQDLEITMRVDGDLRQRARTSAMVFPIAQCLEAMAQVTTLRPGDVIATGTPEGVSAVQPGQRMTVAIEGLGALENPVVREDGAGS